MKSKLVFAFLILIPLISAALPVALYDQGIGVKLKSTGQLLSSGQIVVEIYDALTGGNLIYSETFSNGIVNGNWNLLLGGNPSNPLYLEYGKKYYRDYTINGANLDFTDYSGATVPRQIFYSPLGSVSSDFFSTFYSKTNQTYTGSLSSNNLTGYKAANYLCSIEFPETHLCNQKELIITIQSTDISSLAEWEGTAWVSSGGSKFPSALTASDCRGFTVGDSTALGNFWIFDTTTGGQGSIVNCAQLKPLACCK